MRRILMAATAAAALVVAAGTARAGDDDRAGDDARASDDELAPMPTAPAVFELRRYAFDTMGRSAAEMTALGCLGGQASKVWAHHTARDVAAAVFTAGWYTPVHVTVECPTTTRP